MKAKEDVKLILSYKNFAAQQGISHIGLGVSAMNTVKVLNSEGFDAHVLPVRNDQDVIDFVRKNSDITHFCMQAPWIKTETWRQLCHEFPRITFGFICHSNVGFLQADPNGIKFLREGLELEAGTSNFHVGGNSKKFVHFVQHTYGMPCAFLPNLYYIPHTSHHHRPGWPATRGTLKIGVFGATRGLKNFLSAIGAGIQISRELKAQTEIWINTERDDGPESKTIRRSVHSLASHVPHVQIKELPWRSWPEFRQVVGSMHLLLQPSYTESFNMVTADGVVMGVPSVVSRAIPWAPKDWVAEVDDVNDIARTGVKLINDPKAAWDGLMALRRFVDKGILAWEKYLTRGAHRHGGFDVL